MDKTKLVALTMALTVAPPLGAEMTAADKKHYAPVSCDTHIFRPLGYRTPNNKPRYKLLGTIVVGKNVDTGTWAYMSRSNDWSIVTVIKEGVTFNGSIVKEITNRKVVMENGDIYEQKSVEFLGDEKRRTGRSSKESSSRAGITEDQVRESGQSERTNSGAAQTSGRNGRRNASSSQRERWRERAKEFESASPEDRLRMIEQFRTRRGRR